MIGTSRSVHLKTSGHFHKSVLIPKQLHTKMVKRGRPQAYLERALSDIGKENKSGPSFGFSSMKDSNGTTSPDGKTLTFDPSKPAMQDARSAAGVIAEEGTHSADKQDPRAATSPLSPFAMEFRGHQSNAWAVQGALGPDGGMQSTTNAGNTVTIWNPVDGHRETDAEITTQVSDDYGYGATTPPNPWNN